MKIVNDIVVRNPIKPLAGCVCSSGRTDTRGPWDPFWNCNCSCAYGTENYNANHGRADAK